MVQRIETEIPDRVFFDHGRLFGPIDRQSGIHQTLATAVKNQGMALDTLEGVYTWDSDRNLLAPVRGF